MNPAQEAAARLTELEIKASFTEDLLDQLNLVVYRQQQQIDALVQQVLQLRQQQRPDADGSGPRDAPPPHY